MEVARGIGRGPAVYPHLVRPGERVWKMERAKERTNARKMEKEEETALEFSSTGRYTGRYRDVVIQMRRRVPRTGDLQEPASDISEH